MRNLKTQRHEHLSMFARTKLVSLRIIASTRMCILSKCIIHDARLLSSTIVHDLRRINTHTSFSVARRRIGSTTMSARNASGTQANICMNLCHVALQLPLKIRSEHLMMVSFVCLHIYPNVISLQRNVHAPTQPAGFHYPRLSIYAGIFVCDKHVLYYTRCAEYLDEIHIRTEVQHQVHIWSLFTYILRVS